MDYFSNTTQMTASRQSWDEKSQFLDSSDGITWGCFIGATENTDTHTDMGTQGGAELDDLSRPCCRHTLTQAAEGSLNQAHQQKREKRNDEEMTRDLHNEKDHLLF